MAKWASLPTDVSFLLATTTVVPILSWTTQAFPESCGTVAYAGLREDCSELLCFTKRPNLLGKFVPELTLALLAPLCYMRFVVHGPSAVRPID